MGISIAQIANCFDRIDNGRVVAGVDSAGDRR